MGRITRKTVTMISGAGRNQAPWWKQQKNNCSSQNYTEDSSTKTRSDRRLRSTGEGEEKWGDSEASNYASPLDSNQTGIGRQRLCDENQGKGGVGKEHHVVSLKKDVLNLSISDHHMDQVSHARENPQNSKPIHLVTRTLCETSSKQATASPSLPRKWKKISS